MLEVGAFKIGPPRPALRTALGEAGPTIPEAELLADVIKRVTQWSDVDPYYSDQTFGLPKSSESRGTEAILNALVLANHDAQEGRLTSDTRQALRRFFEVDAECITVAALHELEKLGKCDAELVATAIKDFDIDPEKVDPRTCQDTI